MGTCTHTHQKSQSLQCASIKRGFQTQISKYWPNSGRKGSVTAPLGRTLLPAMPVKGSRGSQAHTAAFALPDVPLASGELGFSSSHPS